MSDIEEVLVGIMKTISIALLTMLLSWSPFTAADPVTKWTFVGVAGQIGEITGRDLQRNDLWELGLDGSFDLFKLLAIQADASTGTTQINENIDTKNAGLGVALHFAIGTALDIYVPFQYRYLKTDALGISTDQGGYLIGLGLRGMANQFVEYQVEIAHSDFGTVQGLSLDDQSLNMNLRWHVSDLFSFAVGLEATTETDRRAFTGDIRFSF